MDEDAIQDAYTLFQKEGYTKSLDDFKTLVKSNPNALGDAFTLFKKNGYRKDEVAFSELMGVKKKAPSSQESSSFSPPKEVVLESPTGTVESTISLDGVEPLLTKDEKAKAGRSTDRINRSLSFKEIDQKGEDAFINQGLSDEDFDSFKRLKFREILEQDLQPKFRVSERIKNAKNVSPLISEEFVASKVFQNRVEEGYNLLPSKRDKRLFDLNVMINDSKEKLKESPLDIDLMDKLYGATKERDGLINKKGYKMGAITNANNTLMFDDDGEALDKDFAGGGVTKESFLKDIQGRLSKFEAIKDRGKLVKVWNDEYEKFKALEEAYKNHNPYESEVTNPVPTGSPTVTPDQPLLFEKEDVKSYLKEQYLDQKKDFLAVNYSLLTNIDPSSIKRKWYDLIGSGFKESVKGGDNFSRSEVPERYAKAVTEAGGEITNKQAFNAKTTILDDSLKGLGATLPIMGQIMVTTALSRGAGAIPAVKNGMQIAEGLIGQKYGKLALSGFKLIKDSAAQGLAFELAPNDETSFAMGAGEELGEKGFTALANRLNKFQKPFAKFAGKIIAGGTTSFVGEYTGELTNELKENGFDIGKAVDKVIGKNADEAVRKAATTALLTFMLSSSAVTTKSLLGKTEDHINQDIPEDAVGKEALKEDIENFKENNKKAFEKAGEKEGVEDGDVVKGGEDVKGEDKKVDIADNEDVNQGVDENVEVNEEVEVDKDSIIEESEEDFFEDEDLITEESENEFTEGEDSVDDAPSIESDVSEVVSKVKTDKKVAEKKTVQGSENTYITENLKYEISENETGDGLEIKDRSGNIVKVSGATRRTYEQEYLASKDWGEGKRALDNVEFSEKDNPSEVIAKESENAIEVAEALIDEQNNRPPVDPLIELVIGQKVSKKSFIDHSDKNNINFTLARSWFKKGGTPLDLIAKRAESEIYGDNDTTNPRVTEQDVVDIILNNPNNYLKKTTEVEEMLGDRFREITKVNPTIKNLNSVLGKVTTDKNATNQEETPLTENELDPEEVPFQFERAPIFYSTAKKGLEEVTQKAATPQQWVKMIADKGGKGTTQELEWIGLEDYLSKWVKDNKKKGIPKEVVEQYLEDNQLEIVEVENAEPNEADIDALLNDELGEGMTREEAIEYLKNDQDGVRYSEHQLKGGENYREILLTLPIKIDKKRFAELNKKIDQLEEQREIAFQKRLDGRLSDNEKDISEQVYNRISNEIQELMPEWESLRFGDSKKIYKSSHWNESNVLAHVRLNERTTPNGDKVLFIEEIQSDWAQEGKKKGFNDLKLTNSNILEENGVYYLKDKDGRLVADSVFIKNASSLSKEELHTLLIKEALKETALEGEVTDMPYKKTDQWVGMAFRRVLKYASDNGYNRVAWTTGEQQTKRYNLSEQIDEINYSYNAVDDLYNLDIVKDGKYVDSKRLQENELEGYIGKEVAKKIVSGKATKESSTGLKTLSGLDLEVGGKGMKTFYNSILPKVAEKEAKRFDKQARVGVIEFKETGKQLSIPVTEPMKKAFEKGVPFFQNQTRFKEITFDERKQLIERLKKAIPAKVYSDALGWVKGKRVLIELGYNVNAMFGNEVMALNSYTKKLFEQAKKLDAQGKTAAETREATGWFIGLDGNWKYAIDDTYARFLVNEKGISKFVEKGTVLPLKRVLIHEELERYYPDLVNKIKVKFYESQDKNEGGSIQNHSDGTYTIRTNAKFQEENGSVRAAAMETLRHEIQHVIQGMERGVRWSRYNDVGGTREGDLYQLLKRGKLKIYREGSDKEIKYRHLPDAKLRLWAWKLYESHSEEIGSRAAANGNDLQGEIAQLNTPFYWVESVDRNNKVILKNTKGVQFMRNRNGEPLGFVDPRNGDVYIHPNKINANTPIHEFAHLYVSGIKQANKPLYKKGIELIKDSIYYDRIKNHPGYQNLSEPQLLEEALVTAIGDQGEAFINKTERSAFRRFLERLKRWIVGKMFKGSKVVDKMDLDTFLQGSVRDLLSGKDLGLPKPTSDGSISFQFAQDNNAAEDLPTLQKLNSRLKSELGRLRVNKELVKAVRKKVVEYIDESLNSKDIGFLAKRDIRGLLTNVENAKTAKSLKKSIGKVDALIKKLRARKLLSDINKVLKRKLTKKVSGRRKGNLTDAETAKILNGVRSILKGNKKRRGGAKRSKAERDASTSEYVEELRELVAQTTSDGSKNPLYEEDASKRSGINLAIRLLSGQYNSDVDFRLSQLEKSHKDITAIYDEGRSNQKEWEEQRKKERDENLKKAIDEVRPKGEELLKTEKEIESDKKHFIKHGIPRLLYSIFNGFTMGDLDSVFRVISKKASDTIFGGYLLGHISPQMRRAEQSTKYAVRTKAEEVVQKQKNIYGSKYKARNRLNKTHNIIVKRENSEKELIPVELTFTTGQLIYAWMNNKNLLTRERMQANDYDAEFMNTVDAILNAKDLEYGTFLFSIYNEYHGRVNSVYETHNNHPLGKPEFYAGKLYGSADMTAELDIMNGMNIARTTAGGSSKERTKNNTPIDLVHVDDALQRYILEMEHYIHHADLHREISSFLDNSKFRAAVKNENKATGDLLISIFRRYVDDYMVRGGRKTSRIKMFDAMYSNFVIVKLAIKLKISLLQTVSVISGTGFLPGGVSNLKYSAGAFSPGVFAKDAKHLLKDSKYLKNRLTGKELIGLLANINTSQATYTGGLGKGGSVVRGLGEGYRAFQNALMVNVKAGDILGVMGSVPVYSAHKAMYLAQGMGEVEAEAKAILKFEVAVDRAQQTQSSYGKSFYQIDPLGRMFFSFSSAPTQYYRHVQNSSIELLRKAKGQESKGSIASHAWNIANFGVMQPLLYAYLTQMALGSLGDGLYSLIGDDEDQADDFDKALASAFILGNLPTVPLLGDILLLMTDKKLLEKDQSFGDFLGSPFFAELDKLKDVWIQMNDAKTDEVRDKYKRKYLGKVSELLSGLPIETHAKYIELFKAYAEGDILDEYDLIEQFGLIGGYSKRFIVDERKKRREGQDKSKGKGGNAWK